MSFRLTERKNELSGLVAELERKNQQFVQESAEAIKGKSVVNIHIMGAIDTGELLNSQEKRGNGGAAEAVSGAAHSGPVNFGHRTAAGTFVPARPFFTQAVDEVRSGMSRKAKEVFNR